MTFLLEFRINSYTLPVDSLLHILVGTIYTYLTK